MRILLRKDILKMNTSLPDSPEELEDLIVLGEIEISIDQRRPDRVYVREITDGILKELPNHGTIILVEEDGTEQEE